MTRAAKKLYFTNGFKQAKSNPKKTWDLLREAINSKSKQEGEIETISINGEQITDKKLIAEEFNSFFARAGHNVSSSIPQSSKSPESFLPPTEYPEFHLGETSQAEICNILKECQAKKSIDIDGVSLHLLKKVALEISTPLASIFNLSLRTGKFPKALKTARIIPLFKGGDTTNCDNYRPISLLCSL